MKDAIKVIVVDPPKFVTMHIEESKVSIEFSEPEVISEICEYVGDEYTKESSHNTLIFYAQRVDIQRDVFSFVIEEEVFHLRIIDAENPWFDALPDIFLNMYEWKKDEIDRKSPRGYSSFKYDLATSALCKIAWGRLQGLDEDSSYKLPYGSCGEFGIAECDWEALPKDVQEWINKGH